MREQKPKQILWLFCC